MTVLSTLSKEIVGTAEAGILIAVVMTGWKFQSIYQDIVRSAYKDFRKASSYYIDTSYRLHSAAVRRSKFSKSRINSAITRFLAQPQVQICIALFQYFIRFPLFVGSLRIFLKFIGTISDNENQRKIVSLIKFIAIFIASFMCQYRYKVLHWRWILFLLIRSIYSLFKLLIPNDLQPNIIYIYPIIHGLVCIMLTKFYEYVPSKWWVLFENCLNENRMRCNHMYNHHHSGLSPPCNIIHDYRNDACFKAFIMDMLRKIPYIFAFFARFYAVTTIINVSKWLNALKNKTFGMFLLRIFKDLIGSFGFFWISSVGYKLPCLFRSIGMFRINQALFMSINIMLGYLCILCESKQRRLMVALSCIWNILQVMIRYGLDLKSDDNARYHKILSSDKFSSFLFSLNMTIIMFVYNSNPKCVKSMERMIIRKYFAN